MLLNIVHETRYDYSPPVRTAQHVAHLKPAHNGRQRLLRHRLTVTPQPAGSSEDSDAFGNARAFFSLQSAHDSLTVAAHSVVATTRPAAGTGGGMPWEDARERLRYHRRAAYDRAAEFVFASPHVPRHEQFLAYAQPSFAPARALTDAVRELMQRIHADFVYEPHATDVSTPALEVLATRRGVCQDFAHVMLACLRSLGLPARYVSGYLLTRPPAGTAALVGSDASHAWVSVYEPHPGVPGAGQWTDFDPTNNREPGEEYVVLATGRDYSDVSPLRGVLHGGAHHELRVAVTVAPLEDGAGFTAPGEPGR